MYINSLATTELLSSCLLFADDIVLLSEDPTELQDLIHSLHNYCKQYVYQLEINTSKTKILVFGQNQKHINYQWTLPNEPTPLEIIGKFKYLGTWLNWNCTFTDCYSQIYDKASQSLNQLQIKIISLGINNYKVLQHLYKLLILPILLYNAEIWGLGNVDLLEKIQRKYFKFILRVSQSSSNSAILAETGTLPISYESLRAVLKYYHHFSTLQCPLVKRAFEISLRVSESGYDSWAYKIVFKLCLLGFNPQYTSPSLDETLQRLYDQAIQKLRAEIDLERGHTQSGGSKLRMYRTFKSDVREAEPYLFLIANPKIRQDYTKFQISDHNLHIETGCRTKPSTPTANRTCSLCQSTSIENEVHFLVDCM